MAMLDTNILRGAAAQSGMVQIPGGTFRMGSDRHYAEEAPAHNVTVDGF
jgi:formylglycine-generating enzyme